jgi:hypothetical protein
MQTMSILRLTGAAVLVSLALSPNAAMALSSAQCSALFVKADRNRDGSLNGYEARPYLSVMSHGPIKQQKITIISRDEFYHECRKPAFDGFAGG